MLVLVTPLGFYTKFYAGPGRGWVNDSLGGLFYVVFWCLAVTFVRPRSRPGVVAVSVLGVTCLLEFLQLWHPPFLEMIRSHFIGRTLIGDYFDWNDFPYYFAGAGIGWALAKWIRPE